MAQNQNQDQDQGGQQGGQRQVGQQGGGGGLRICGCLELDHEGSCVGEGDAESQAPRTVLSLPPAIRAWRPRPSGQKDSRVGYDDMYKLL